MLRERKQHLSFPHELYWLTLPLVLVFSALNQNDNHDDLARRVYVATQAVLEDGVGFVLESPSTGEDDNKKKILSDPALPREETTQKSQKAALPWDEAPVPSAPVRSKRSGETSALSLRLGIEQATAFSSETPRNETVPRQWAEHALQMLVSADPHFIRQLLDAAITPYVAASKDATAVVPSGCGYSDVDVDIFISLVGHLLRTGLVSVLPTAATLFLWDQCVLSSFRLCIPLGVATLLLALHKEVSELALDATRRDWHSNFIRLVSLSGRDVSPAKFERLFQQHALPFVLASGTVRKPPQEMLSRPSPTLIRNVLQTSASHIQRFRPEKSSLTIAEGGIFRPHADLVIEPSGIHEYMENLPAQNFTWSAVCPAEDTLASIVDKVIDESQNIQAMNYIRHAWSQRKIEVNATSDSDPNVTVRRNLAVRVLRSLPCFAALYESFPRAIATEISTILNDAIKVDLPVDAAETTASRVLGEEPVMVTVILPSSNHNREELAKPRGESLQCAVVVALRASKCALWPHLRQNVLKLSDAAYEMYRKQRELRGIALVTMSHRKEGEEAAAAKDVLRRHGAAAIGDDFYEKSGSNEQPYRESNESQIANLSLDSELMVAQAVADVERSSEQSIIETDAIATPKESRYLDSTASNDAKTSDEVQINAAQNIHQQAIARAIAETQTKVFQRSYTKEELALMTPKERKVYSKKYTKWTKAFRSRWKSDSELRAAVPTLETVETLLTSWAPSSGH